MSLKIEKISRELEIKKQELELDQTETQAAQIELDKTADDFKKIHQERQELVRQWNEAIEAMGKRDEMIKAAGERFAMGKQKIREKQEKLLEENNHLNIHIQNNKELEQRIAKSARELEKFHAKFEEIKATIMYDI